MQNNRYIYWLGDMSIHSRLKCFLSVFFKGICSHGHNWDICFSIIAECPNLSVQLIIHKGFETNAVTPASFASSAISVQS